MSALVHVSLTLDQAYILNLSVEHSHPAPWCNPRAKRILIRAQEKLRQGIERAEKRKT